MPENPQILIVDDDRGLACACAANLEAAGYYVHVVHNAPSALQAIDQLCVLRQPISVLLADIILDPDSGNGVEVAEYFWRSCSSGAVLFMSGDMEAQKHLRGAEKEGIAFYFLEKPFAPEELRNAVGELVSRGEERAA
jgi:DNA-binding response OmpR family regulator